MRVIDDCHLIVVLSGTRASVVPDLVPPGTGGLVGEGVSPRHVASLRRAGSRAPGRSLPGCRRASRASDAPVAGAAGGPCTGSLPGAVPA